MRSRKRQTAAQKDGKHHDKIKKKTSHLNEPPKYPCDQCYGKAACDEMGDGEGGFCWNWWEWFKWKWPETCRPFREEKSQ